MQQVIVYSNETGGVTVCHPSGQLSIEDTKAKDTPAHSIIVDKAVLPEEYSVFFDAWELSGEVIVVNVDKAKTVSHGIRRAAREKELAPYDAIIAKQIPGKSAQDAEAARVVIRAKYADMQTAIDAASTVDQIKAAMPQG